MKPKIWHRWVEEIFPDDELISVNSLMERLTDYIRENNKSTLNLPFRSALSHYLTHIGKYQKIKDMWVKLG